LPPQGLVPAEPRPQRDENRRGELDQQRDPDRQALDREEVEPLDEREAADSVEDEQGQLLPARPEATRGGEREHCRKPDEGAGAAELRQPLGTDSAGRQDHLRDDAVDREERCRREGHRKPDPRCRRAVAGGTGSTSSDTARG
jgi:hypothetical protein